MKIVISGTSSGIGQGIAEHLVQQGHSVWGLARSPQVDQASRLGPSFHHSVVDVSDWSQVEKACGGIVRAWEKVDAVIACAGVQGEVGPAMQNDPRRWSDTVRANLDGTFFLIRGLYSALSTDPRRAKIICFSGGGATKARPNFTAYGVAKTGVVRLVETLAEEWKGLSLDINAIAPGAINTRLTDEVLALGPDRVGKSEYEGALKQKQTGGASLTRVYGLVDFLLSSKSDGISGRLIAAPWDPWTNLHVWKDALEKSDIYQLRRIVPEERGQNWKD